MLHNYAVWSWYLCNFESVKGNIYQNLPIYDLWISTSVMTRPLAFFQNFPRSHWPRRAFSQQAMASGDQRRWPLEERTWRFQVSVQHCLGPHGCHKHRYKHLPETVDPMAIDHLKGNVMTHFLWFFFRFDVAVWQILKSLHDALRLMMDHFSTYLSWNLRISGLSTPHLLSCKWSTCLF